MSTQSFERLRIWHESRRLVRSIYTATNSKSLAGDSAFRSQIRRAALSVMSNIAERYERGSRKEFLHFLAIARASAGEVRSQLYAGEDIGYFSADLAGRLRHESAAVSRQIAALEKRMRAR